MTRVARVGLTLTSVAVLAWFLLGLPVGTQANRCHADTFRGGAQRNCDFLSNKYVFDWQFDQQTIGGTTPGWTTSVASGRPLLGDGVTSSTDPRTGPSWPLQAR